MPSPDRRAASATDGNQSGVSRRELLALAALGLATGPAGLATAAEAKGELTWGIHVSLAPTWFDPGEASGIITPFMVLYALHDALVKPMPGPGLVHGLAPSLAESWSMSEDGRSYSLPSSRAGQWMSVTKQKWL